MSTYARLPVTFTRGEGPRLWDDQGHSYLDALSGIAVCGLGHAHADVTRALCEQAATLVHTSNIYGIAHQEALAERLSTVSGLDKVFFANSGAEANEAAIKLARLHGRKLGIARPHMVVAEGAFHGRTLATLTATGNRHIQQGFEPLVEGFRRVPYNDADAIEELAESCDDIVAVMLEPVLGEGGVVVPDAGYLKRVRAICDRHQWLLILDEIQTGMGRTGRWFAFQHAGIVPDVATLAKSLGNGVPIGTCLAGGAAADLFQPGSHGSTFGGNPLVCRTALEVIAVIERDGLIQRAQALGARMLEGLRGALANHQDVNRIQGHGLMLGIELSRPCKPLVQQALGRGLLINVTAERVIRLLPPLILSDAEADEIVDMVVGLVHAFLNDDAGRETA